jgi:hypothetical protein
MLEHYSKTKINKQWTNKFGEYICEEILMLLSYKV